MYWAQNIFNCLHCNHFKIFHSIFIAIFIPKLHLWRSKIDMKSKPTLVMTDSGLAHYLLLHLRLHFELFYLLGEIVKSIRILSKSINGLLWMTRMKLEFLSLHSFKRNTKQTEQTKTTSIDPVFITSVLKNRKLIPTHFYVTPNGIYFFVTCFVFSSTLLLGDL